VSQFVLHDICSADCLNLQKAAYVVDNPDFDCLKGVAGFSIQEAYPKDLWQSPDSFIQHMEKASFNKKVRGLTVPSMRRNKKSDKDTTRFVADYLEIIDPVFCTWAMKHDNHGFLVYETQKSCPAATELVLNGACYLGFCPVY